jgi:iron complex transport system ATP-binding protein
VLHDIEQAARLADHMVVLKDGEVRARGAPAEIVTEELLRRVFRIEARVERTERGPRIEAIRPYHGDVDTGDGAVADGSNDGGSTGVESRGQSSGEERDEPVEAFQQ